uniref:Alternative protein WNK1 n=1 Tax=Homo sapiens TaxID=9606 RepID=L8EA38_HUMAN|nr:alternative protein WNK1 [Homo sapiens]
MFSLHYLTMYTVKNKNKNSNFGGFSAAVNCTFCTNSGCCASCKIALCASVCYLCRLI